MKLKYLLIIGILLISFNSWGEAITKTHGIKYILQSEFKAMLQNEGILYQWVAFKKYVEKENERKFQEWDKAFKEEKEKGLLVSSPMFLPETIEAFLDWMVENNN